MLVEPAQLEVMFGVVPQEVGQTVLDRRIGSEGHELVDLPKLIGVARMADGAGCINCETVSDTEGLASAFARMLDDGALGFLVAKIEPGKYPWEWKDRKPTDGIEDKYRFLRYVETLEGVVIHPGAPQN